MPSAERWPYSSSGTSFQVMTAWTPCIDSAALVSSPVMSARWTGERSALTQSVPGHADVVDEDRASGDVLDAVVPRQACADRFHFTPPMLVMPGLAAVVARSNESPRATAATASMIFT